MNDDLAAGINPDRPIYAELDVHKSAELSMLQTPAPICRGEILPRTYLYLQAWPSRWARFWHWALFGIRWEKLP